MRRRDIVVAAAGAVVTMVLAGGVAWAAIPGEGGVYTACMLKNIGTVRLIDKSLPPSNLMSHCKPLLEVEILWNERGPQGLQGIQGQPGADGAPGSDGDDGEPFAGSFTSPNGEYSISVTNAGITIAHGTTSSITLAGDDLTVRSNNVDVRSDLATIVRAGSTATVHGASGLTLRSNGTADLHADGVLDLEGSAVNVN